jgi:hypothetical protein
MQDFVHKVAIYRDDAGVRHEIRVEDLSDPKIFEKAKGLKLFDESEQVRLSPRQIEDNRPHFVAPATEVNRSVFKFEKNPVHDERVDFLLDALKAGVQWKILESHYENSQSVTTDLFQISDYSWGKEKHRIVSADAIVRHDLFGQAVQIEMSIFRPWIAIEVINTHYPEEGAFKAFIELSRMFPLIVMFDCTDRQNDFLKIDKQAGTVNTRLHIRDGAVWFNGQTKDIQSSIAFELFIKKEIKNLNEKDDWKRKKAAEARAKSQ